VDDRHHDLDALLDAVAANYDLGHWWDTQPVAGGFRIAAEAGEFRAALSPGDRSDASLRFEAMLLIHLADKAYVSPRLVRTRAGRPWHRSLTGTAVQVTEWAQGGVVDASLAQHRGRSVRALAEYHAAVRSFPPRLRADGGPTLHALEHGGPAALEAFAGLSGWYLDADGRQRLRSASSYLWRQFNRVPGALRAGGATLPRLVIHGDFGLAAVVLDEARDVNRAAPADGLAAFARVRYDARAVDLAAAIQAFARVAGGFDLDRCAALVAAYDEVDHLSPGEVEALPLILRVERLTKVFRSTAGLQEGASPPAVSAVVEVIEHEADHLRWLEKHEGALIEALGSALVG
jgi:Ser/Thr protein kinase RdoA (MazF antagonist)